MGISKFDSYVVSQPVQSLLRLDFAKKPAISGLSALSRLSPDSEIQVFFTSNAENLCPAKALFLNSGELIRRSGSI